MRSRRATTIRELRAAIDCLPRRTREAMLSGIRANEIVVGAYTHDGGVCPMLAAHRAGGRTDCIAFARAWDRFALGTGRAARKARRATQRELAILVSHLEASLLAEETPAFGAGELGRVIAEHRALQEARLRRQRPRPGDPDRTKELRQRDGWAWTRPFRRLEDYERALARLEEYREREPAWV
jgi:hypothetical protein